MALRSLSWSSEKMKRSYSRKGKWLQVGKPVRIAEVVGNSDEK